MSMLKFSQLPFLMMIALLSVGTFIGCNDDPESPDGTDVVVPKQGSTYTYTEYEVDDQGNKDESTEVEVIATVERTGLSIGGKTGVLEFLEEYEDGTIDTVYTAYESNGDVSLFFGVEEAEDIDPLWVTIPFGSKTTKTYPISDTVDDGMGGTTIVTVNITTKYLRSETVTIQGETLEVWVGELALTGSFPSPFGGTIDINSAAQMYFAPEIGYITKSDATTSGFGFDGRTIRMLVSYSLAN